MRGDNFVGIFNIATGRQPRRLRHLQHEIRLRNRPARRPRPRRWCFVRIARYCSFRGPCRQFVDFLGESEESFENFPTVGSANLGGMVLACVAARIASAKGFVSAYVSNAIGAIPPARWQASQ